MVEGFDNKATLFCYVDFVFLSFLAVLKISFCYGTPCNLNLENAVLHYTLKYTKKINKDF